MQTGSHYTVFRDKPAPARRVERTRFESDVPGMEQAVSVDPGYRELDAIEFDSIRESSSHRRKVTGEPSMPPLPDVPLGAIRESACCRSGSVDRVHTTGRYM